MSLTCRWLTAVLLAASPAIGAESVTLKPMFTPGMRWTFDATTALSLDNKATLNGQSQSFTIKNTAHHVGKAEVVSTADGVVTSLRVSFDDGSHDQMTVAGNDQSKDFPYAGKTITISRSGNGAITDDFGGQVADDARNELHGLLDSEIVLLPTHPVAVGEEWPADSATLSHMLQLTGDDRAGMTLKLLGTKSIDGQNLAELKVSTVADRHQGDMQIRMILQGTALLDISTGHTVKTDLAGTLQSHGQQAGAGPDGGQVSYAVEGSGTMAVATTAPLGNGSIAAATPQNSAANSPTNAPSNSPSNPLGAPSADPFSGTFSDGKLTVNGSSKDGNYIASLTLGDQKFPATATISSHTLNGSFEASGHPFTFTATLEGDVMTMNTGGKTYTLKRAAPPAPSNPLGDSGAPGGAGDTGINKLPGYAVAVSTDAGKTLTTTKPQVHDSVAAFKAVFSELATYFDGRPTLGGAFQDTRDRSAATASFSAQLNGQPVRGLVSSHLTDAGAAIAVTYCRADADPSAWSKLTDASPVETALPPLKTINFPDNTGSIGIAQGWTTQAQSAMQQVTIMGPADQVITIGSSFPVQSPNSQLIQMQRQTAAIERQMGRNPIPQPQQLVAPYSGPVEAMKNVIPQLSAMSRANGGPTIEVDNIEQVSTSPAGAPGGQAAVLTYGVTRTPPNGAAKHYHAEARVETMQFGNGGWMISCIEVASPSEQFAHDLPLMLAMVNSMRENPEVCAQMLHANANAIQEAQQKQFEKGQEAHREQMASYDAHNKAWAAGEVDKSRQNADVIETIRGERAVLDTTTGEKGYADLMDAGKVVDGLNAHDPGRYQELPLRDELYPVNGK